MTISLEEQIIEVLKTVYDPEIPVNIIDLGLIYRLQLENNHLTVEMTLTNPACPIADEYPKIVESHLRDLPLKSVHVTLVFDPPWTTERMSEAAKLQLGIMD